MQGRGTQHASCCVRRGWPQRACKSRGIRMRSAEAWHTEFKSHVCRRQPQPGSINPRDFECEMPRRGIQNSDSRIRRGQPHSARTSECKMRKRTANSHLNRSPVPPHLAQISNTKRNLSAYRMQPTPSREILSHLDFKLPRDRLAIRVCFFQRTQRRLHIGT